MKAISIRSFLHLILFGIILNVLILHWIAPLQDSNISMSFVPFNYVKCF